MYATIEDMQNAFTARELVQVTDEARTGVMNVDFINNALLNASSEMDSYLATKYVVPVSPIPPLLTMYACDIARFNIWSQKNDAPKVVTDRYNAAIKYLKSLSTGAAKLEAQGIEAAPSNQEVILTSKPNRVFSRDSLRGY